jgi:hypothetical protein
MQSYFRKLLGMVQAKETATEIVITGIDGVSLVRDITKYWKTSRIAANMFNRVSKSEISFYKYFGPDFLYVLTSVLQYRSRYISVRTATAIRQALLESTYLGKAFEETDPNAPGRLDFSMIPKLTFTPDRDQMAYFKDYNHRLDKFNLRGDLCHADPGTGKTYMGMMIAEMLHAEVIVVFCEKRAVELVWEDSTHEMYKEQPTMWHSFEGKPYNGERVVICHYAWLGHFLNLIQTGVFKDKNVVTILDECHNMNDPKSMQTQLYLSCVRAIDCDNNLLMSGTPVKALGSELITLMAVADRTFTPPVEERFRQMYGKEASKGLDIIRHRMGFMSFRIVKTEESTGLKPPIMKPYPVKIPNGADFTLPAIKIDMEKFIRERVAYYKQRRPQDEAFWKQCLQHHVETIRTKEQHAAYKEYLRVLEIVKRNPDPRYVGEEIKATNKYEKEVFGPSLPQKWIHQFRDVKSVIKYTMLKIQGECLGRVLGGKRIECHVAMVPYIDWVGVVESTHKKTIMFTSFVEALETAEQHVAKLGMKPIAVYGKTSNELASIVDRFDKQKELNPLLATYASLATAVRLVMADTMLLVNSPFRSYILEQAIARIYRKGQDSQTVVYTVTLDTGDIPNISTRSADILAWSQAQVEAITGVKSPFETKEAFEHFVSTNPQEFDENKIMHGVLQQAFERYDITIAAENFKNPTVKPFVPAWMR